MPHIEQHPTAGAASRPLTASRLARIGSPLLLIFALAACAAGPDYHRPSTSLESFHNAPAIAARTAPAAPPLDTWWTGFNDPVLNDLVDKALAQNLDLAAAYARVDQARAATEAATARLLPTLDASAQEAAQHQSLNSPLGRIAESAPGYKRDSGLYDAGAAASWEIDLAGGLRRGRNAAADEMQAARAEAVGTRISVAAEVADAYFQIRGDQARVGVVQGQIDVDAHTLDLIEQLHGRGLANDRERSQAEAVLKQAQAALPPLKVALEVQLNRLDVLLGAQPGTYAPELAAARDVPAVPGIPDAGTTTDFLRRRPDVIAAERRLAASSENIGVAMADYYPKLSLSGLLGAESLKGSQLFKGASAQSQVAGGFSWRIFDFGKVDAEIKSAKGANAQALAAYRQSVLRAAEDVEDAFVTLTQTEAMTAQLQDEVNALQHARDLSQQAYAAGSIPLTDVLDANRQLLAAQDQLAQNKADAARAAVKSFRALGGGWQE